MKVMKRRIVVGGEGKGRVRVSVFFVGYMWCFFGRLDKVEVVI